MRAGLSLPGGAESTGGEASVESATGYGISPPRVPKKSHGGPDLTGWAITIAKNSGDDV